MRVIVNGEPREFPEGVHAGGLVESLGLRRETVVVEVNRVIVERGHDEAHVLREGDQVELIQFVGGG
jgi:sulfur carrier protein